MPLLHEIKDPINENILCFVPNGHLTENGFEDFPAPSIVRSWHIWHYANRRLASLKHTQNPFSEQEYGQAEMYFSQLADNIYALKYIVKLCMDTLYDIGLAEIINVNQNYLINYLNTKQDQLHDHLKAHCAEKKFGIVNVKTNNELFMEIFLKVGEIIATNKASVNFNNPTTFNETMQMLVDSFFESILNDIRAAYLMVIPLNEIIERSNLNRDLTRDNIDFGQLQSLSLNLNSMVISINENKNQNYKKWKTAAIETLLSRGPFATIGYIGAEFYPDTLPEVYGKLGSIELLTFPPESYHEDCLGGDYSIVIVIGIHKGKVIYLDPLLDSKVSDPRQAFVMDIHQFIAGLSVVYNNKLRFITLEKNEIDTTLELMLEHTKMELPSGLYSYVYYKQNIEEPRRAIDFKVIPKIRTHKQKTLVNYSRDRDPRLYSSIEINNVKVYRRRDDHYDTHHYGFYDFDRNIAISPAYPLIALLDDASFIRHESIEDLPIDDIIFFNNVISGTIKEQMLGNYEEQGIEYIGLDLSFQKLQRYLINNACHYAANNSKLDLDTVTRPMVFFSAAYDGALKPVSVLPHVLSRAILDEMIATCEGREITVKHSLSPMRAIFAKLHVEIIHTSTIGMFDRSPDRLELIKNDVLDDCVVAFLPGSPFEASRREFAIVDEQDYERFKVLIEEKVYYSTKRRHRSNISSPLGTILSIILPQEESSEISLDQSPFYKFITALAVKDPYGYYTDGYRRYLTQHDLEVLPRNFVINLSALNEKQLSDFWRILASMREFAFEEASNLIQDLIKCTHPKHLLDPTYEQIKSLILNEKYSEALALARQQDEMEACANVHNNVEYTHLVASLLFDISAAQSESLEGFNYIRKVAKGLVVREAHDKSAQISIAMAGREYNKEQYLDTIKTCLFSAGSNSGGERCAVFSLINNLSGNRKDVKDKLDRLKEKEFLRKNENEIVGIENFATDVIGVLTELLKSDLTKQTGSRANATKLNPYRSKRFNSI